MPHPSPASSPPPVWRAEPEAPPESVGMDPAALDALTLRTFGHGGAGGQIVFADPDRELAMSFLTNGELSPDFVRWRHRLQGRAFEACVD